MPAFRKMFAAFLALATLSMAAAKSSNRELKEVADEKYKPGQVWSYKARPGEKNSTLTVLRIEATKEKRIVHIRVDNVRLRNCLGGNEPDTFEHMPFSREALDESVIANLRTGAVPDYRSGYSEWRKGWDAGKAGFYTISVSQAIEVAQKTFDQGLGCAD